MDKKTWKTILEMIAYVCTAIAGYLSHNLF